MSTEQRRAVVTGGSQAIDADLVGACRGASAAAAEPKSPIPQAARLEALGRLTASVAHDFNNLLMVIQGENAILRRKVTEPDAEPHLDAIHQAGERAVMLVRELLTFARGGDCVVTTVDLATAVDKSMAAVRQLVGPNISVHCHRPSGPAHVEICAVQFEAALLNLAANARDAMPLGGILDFATRVEPDLVELRVSDTGAGIPPDVVSRAFDPFFTTKEVGKGTGLGLAQVRSTVRRAGGSVQIRSAMGRGTTVVLRLPRAEF